jgi:hypothetical protein
MRQVESVKSRVHRSGTKLDVTAANSRVALSEGRVGVGIVDLDSDRLGLLLRMWAFGLWQS